MFNSYFVDKFKSDSELSVLVDDPSPKKKKEKKKVQVKVALRCVQYVARQACG